MISSNSSAILPSDSNDEISVLVSTTTALTVVSSSASSDRIPKEICIQHSAPYAQLHRIQGGNVVVVTIGAETASGSDCGGFLQYYNQEDTTSLSSSSYNSGTTKSTTRTGLYDDHGLSSGFGGYPVPSGSTAESVFCSTDKHDRIVGDDDGGGTLDNMTIVWTRSSSSSWESGDSETYRALLNNDSSLYDQSNGSFDSNGCYPLCPIRFGTKTRRYHYQRRHVSRRKHVKSRFRGERPEMQLGYSVLRE